MKRLSIVTSLSLFRQSGDIDIYIDVSHEVLIVYVKSLGDGYLDWDHKYLHLKVLEDSEVEVHYVLRCF